MNHSHSHALRKINSQFTYGIVSFLLFFIAGVISTDNLAQTNSAKSARAGNPKEWAQKAFELYEKDKVTAAIKLYERAARAGDLSSAYNLAVIRITDENRAIPLPRALAFLRQAANGNYGLAQHMLGSLYEQGRHVERSQQTAFTWFERAANNQVKEAYSDLATQLYLGRGIAQDYAKSAYWYEKSADAGDASAQYILASMYETGLGVTADLQTALTWYSAAARQGDEAAKAKAKDMVTKISEQRKSAVTN
jgi:uncharacterized protein